jgi:hypothetical protein
VDPSLTAITSNRDAGYSLRRKSASALRITAASLYAANTTLTKGSPGVGTAGKTFASAPRLAR